MPVKHGVDPKGNFYRYGNSGKKYYYKTTIGKTRAYNKASKQEKAIKARGYKGNGVRIRGRGFWSNILEGIKEIASNPLTALAKQFASSNLLKMKDMRGRGRDGFKTLPYKPPIACIRAPCNVGKGRKRKMRGGDNTSKIKSFVSKLKKDGTISKFLGKTGFPRASSVVASLGYGRGKFKILPYKVLRPRMTI